jgi:hypothetical protein
MLPLEGDEGTKEPVVDGWRKTLMNHINNPNHSTDKKVWHQAMKYTLVDGKLYRRTMEGLLLKCLRKRERQQWERCMMGYVGRIKQRIR